MTKPKRKYFKLCLPWLKCGVGVYAGYDKEVVRQYAQEIWPSTNFGEFNDTEGAAEGGCFLPKDSAACVMFFAQQKPNAGVIAHEALHAVFHMMRKRDMLPDVPQGQDELITYLVEWLVDEITRRLK